jgi:hypothetical protein
MLIARIMAFVLLVSLSACGGFDKQKWASGKGDYSHKNPRASLVSNAEEAGVKVGASRASIRALLGKPDGTGPSGDSWALGFGGYSTDPRYLNIDYYKNKIATKVNIEQ